MSEPDPEDLELERKVNELFHKRFVEFFCDGDEKKLTSRKHWENSERFWITAFGRSLGNHGCDRNAYKSIEMCDVSENTDTYSCSFEICELKRFGLFKRRHYRACELTDNEMRGRTTPEGQKAREDLGERIVGHYIFLTDKRMIKAVKIIYKIGKKRHYIDEKKNARDRENIARFMYADNYEDFIKNLTDVPSHPPIVKKEITVPKIP